MFKVLSRGFQTKNINGAVWSNMHYLTILTVFVIALRGNYSSPDQMVGKILSPFAPRLLTHYKFIVATPIINISNEACKVDELLVSRKVSTYSSSCIEICRMFTQLSASNLYFSSCFLNFMFASVEWPFQPVYSHSSDVGNWKDWSRERSLVVSVACFFFFCNPRSPPKIRVIKDKYSRKT